jgi:hypothetical protein
VNTTIDPAALDALASVHLSALTVERQNTLLRRFVRGGRGIFIEELRRELRRRHIVLPYQAHDLLAELDGRPSTVHLNRVMLRPISHQPSR